MSIAIGQSIGRYHIIEQLGQGGMATVYRAYDTRLKKDVAVKFIRRAAFSADEIGPMLARFDQEAASLARLTHPNIIPIIDFDTYDETPFLVMPFIAGGTLKERIQQLERAGQRMSLEEVQKLLVPVARALAYAHGRGVLHRDVKPGNILITESGEPMLTDFGIARILDTDGNTLTATGMGVGTPEYMAPEQWLGQPEPTSDQYALGIILYELVTGRKPYFADTPPAVMIQHINNPLPRPRQYAPEVGAELERVLFTALAKQPGQRYPDLEAFADALSAAAQAKGKAKAGRGALEKTLPVPPPLEAQTVVTTAAVEKARPGGAGKVLRYALPAGGLLALLFLFLLLRPLFGQGAAPEPTPLPTLVSAAASPTVWEPTRAPEQGDLAATAAMATEVSVLLTGTPEAEPTRAPEYTATSAPAELEPTAAPAALPAGIGQLAYLSQASGVPDFLLMDMASRQTQPLTTDGWEKYYPLWSPDGKTLAYVLKTTSGNYLMTLQVGQEPHSVYALELNPFGWTRDQSGFLISKLVRSWVYPYASYKAWQETSSDTKAKLAQDGCLVNVRPSYWNRGYVSFCSERALMQIQLDTDSEVKIGVSDVYILSARQSYRSGEILYVSNGTGRYTLNVWNESSRKARSFSQIPGGVSNPDWSPDGQWIAFARTDQTASASEVTDKQICVIAASGENLSCLTGLGALNDHPTWSPDGQWITYESNAVTETNPEGDKEIMLMRADGSDMFQLTSNDYDDYAPAWKP